MTTKTIQTKSVFAAIAFGVIAVMPFSVMPLLVGGMISDLALTVKQAGYVASAEMVGSGLAALMVSLVIVRLNRRIASAFALILFVGTNLVAASSESSMALLVVRFFTGISSGIVMAIISAILGSTSSPERNFSFFFMSNLIFGVIAFLTLPVLIFATWGLSGAYYLFAALGAGVLVVFALSIPSGQGAEGGAPEGAGPLSLTSASIAGLVGMLFLYVAVGALWPFVEQLGASRALDQKQIGFVLSATQVSGICGSLAAVWLATRFGRAKPIAFGAAVALLAMALLLFDDGKATYAAAAPLFYFSYLFMLAYMSGVLSALDGAGRIIAIGVTMQTAGLAIGPASAGEFISRSGYTALLWFTSACLLLSLLSMLRADRGS